MPMRWRTPSLLPAPSTSCNRRARLQGLKLDCRKPHRLVGTPTTRDGQGLDDAIAAAGLPPPHPPSTLSPGRRHMYHPLCPPLDLHICSWSGTTARSCLAASEVLNSLSCQTGSSIAPTSIPWIISLDLESAVTASFDRAPAVWMMGVGVW